MRKFALVALAAITLPVSAQAQVGTSFTYQGQLNSGSSSVENAIDVRYTLHDSATTDSVVGSSIVVSNTAFEDGLLNTELDFGAVFDGTPLFLEVEVANPTGSAFLALDPRVELLPVPYASYATQAGTVIGGVDDADADATNELQSLSVNGSALTLSGGGGTVRVSGLSASDGNPTEVVSVNGDGNITVSGPVFLQDAGSAEETVDQTQTSINASQTELDFIQSFTPGLSGNLTSIDVRFAAASTATSGTLSIFEGSGTGGTELANQPYTPSPATGVVNFELSPAPAVDSGQVYTFRFLQGSSGTQTFSVRTGNNPYSGGELLSSGPSDDAVFRTYVTPAAAGGGIEFPDGSVQTTAFLGTADDADADPTNELNTALELNGSVLELSDSGGTLSADLSSLADGQPDGHSLDSDDGSVVDAVFVDSEGQVGLGTTSPDARLHVLADGEARFLSELSFDSTASGNSVDVHWDSHMLYTVNGGTDTFSIIDVSDPEHPRLLSQLVDGTGSFANLAVPQGVFADGDYVYVTSRVDDALTIIDVSDPQNPAFVGEAIQSSGFAAMDGPSNLFVEDGYAYIACRDGDAVVIIDVSDPASPALAAELVDGDGTYSRLEGARDVYVSEGYLYIAAITDDSVTIVDVSDPTAPVLETVIRNFLNGFSDLNGPISVVVEDEIAYVAAFSNNAVSIIDVSDPANPALLAVVEDGDGTYNALAGPSAVGISGVSLYVTGVTDDSVTIIDVSEPTAPVLVAEAVDGDGQFSALDGASGLAVSEDAIAFVLPVLDSDLSILREGNSAIFAGRVSFKAGIQTPGSINANNFTGNGSGLSGVHNTGASLVGSSLSVTDPGGSVGADLSAFQNASAALNGSSVEVTDGFGTVSADLSRFENTSITLNGRNLEVTDGAGTLSADLSALDAASRFAIDALPFTISASGSYYLTGALTGTTDTDGITVLANDVTIDLNGFSITGDGGSTSGHGIIVNGTFSGLNVQNGFVRGWAENGIDGSLGSHGKFQNLMIADNGTDGILMGSNSLVKHCRLFDNGDDGIETGASAVVEQNVSENNSNDGIVVSGDDNVIRHNESLNNGGDGIQVDGNDSTILENRIIENNNGLRVNGSGNRIAENYAFGSGTTNHVLSESDNQYDILISEIPFTINVPCNARVTGNLFNKTENGDGIIIDSDNVTIDLGGFTLYGGGVTEGAGNIDHVAIQDSYDPYLAGGALSFVNSSDDGIRVAGTHQQITIRNGGLMGWGNNGINALTARNSLFQNITVSYCLDDGIVADTNCVIRDCTVIGVGLDGIEADDGSVIINCSATQCGDNGIQASQGCTIQESASYFNQSDGFDIGSGSTIIGCVASGNGQESGLASHAGFDIALGGFVVNCSAYDNGSGDFNSDASATNGNDRGFDLASSCIIRSCIAALNDGDGFRTQANAQLIDCVAHENDAAGILIDLGDTRVEGCVVTDNDSGGIIDDASGSLFIRNKASGNNSSTIFVAPYDNLGEMIFGDSSAFGPIVDVTAEGDLSAITNADHPLANLIY